MLDDKLLARFWERQAEAAASAAEDASINTSSMHRWSVDLDSSSSTSPSHSGPGMPLLDRSQLPEFCERLMVFHRGVGVATAEGLYLDKKLDLLAAYLLVDPATAWLTGLKDSLLAWIRKPQPAAAGAGAGGGGVGVSLPGWSPAGGSSPLALSHLADDAELRPFAPAAAADDLSHQYARLVVRASLRSLMPGPRQVLSKLLQRLVLLVRRRAQRGDSQRGIGCFWSGAAQVLFRKPQPGGSLAGQSTSSCPTALSG